MTRFVKGEKGFTILELLVVISIISALSSVIISSTSKARARGRDGQRYSDIRQINNAIQLYILANGHAPYLEDCFVSPSLGYGQCAIADNHSSYPNSTWDGELATKLSPYIKKLPHDPCGTSCDNPGNGKYFFYSYGSPGNGRAIPDSYVIFANDLETTLQPFGYSTTLNGAFNSE